MAIYGQEEEEPENLNQISLSGALDSNVAWEIQFSYMRRIFPWFGAGVGANMYHQYSDEIDVQGDPIADPSAGSSISPWILSDNSQRATGLQLNPYVHRNTPTLFSIEDAGINLYVEPGLLVTLASDRRVEVDYLGNAGYNIACDFSSNRGDWVFWNCRAGVALENNGGSITLGYFASNMDIYAYKRHIHIDNVYLGDYLPHTHFNWGIYLRLGYNF